MEAPAARFTLGEMAALAVIAAQYAAVRPRQKHSLKHALDRFHAGSTRVRRGFKIRQVETNGFAFADEFALKRPQRRGCSGLRASLRHCGRHPGN
jgi:hypothetical protein